MKKMWMIAAVACAALMVSCGNSPESKADDFAKRMTELTKSGDIDAIRALDEEAKEYYNSLTAEEKAAFDSSMKEAELKYMEELKEVVDEAGKVVGDAISELGVSDVIEEAKDLASDVLNDKDVEAVKGAAELGVAALKAAAEISDDEDIDEDDVKAAAAMAKGSAKALEAVAKASGEDDIAAAAEALGGLF